MPAKRPAPKSAKGKKAASRPTTVRKSAVRKSEGARARSPVPHGHGQPRKNSVAPKKAPLHVPEGDAESAPEPKKVLRPAASATPPSPATGVASAVRAAAPQAPAES